VKKGWEIVSMKSLCSIKNGKSDTQDAVEDGSYAFFDRSKVVKKSNRYLYDCEALIIPGEGKEFLPRYYSGKFDLHQRAYALHNFNKNIDIHFLFYNLHYSSDYFPNVAVGATVKSLRLRHFEEFQVTVPPLPEQQRIVGILDEAFEGIEKAKVNAQRNLDNAREVFESYLNEVFTTRGEGLVKTTIGDVLNLQRGFDITKNEQSYGTVPVVSSGGIKSFHNVALAKSPGVVIGRKGTLGKVYFMDLDYWPHDTTLWVNNFKGNNPKLVYYLLKSINVKQLDSGTANPALNRNLVHPLKVFWPSINYQRAIVDSIEKMDTESQHIESLYRRKLAALDELKQALLHRAFNGEL
jgi:type I restriction enzyme S subunit